MDIASLLWKLRKYNSLLWALFNSSVAFLSAFLFVILFSLSSLHPIIIVIITFSFHIPTTAWVEYYMRLRKYSKDPISIYHIRQFVSQDLKWIGISYIILFSIAYPLLFILHWLALPILFILYIILPIYLRKKAIKKMQPLDENDDKKFLSRQLIWNIILFPLLGFVSDQIGTVIIESTPLYFGFPIAFLIFILTQWISTSK
ncbi:MAG TPA: hypothetical protein VLA74_05250 [Nitrososphaeraceae archaeon]|nr:hypothetical protein [Nitrososphaeraceae archaeon]